MNILPALVACLAAAPFMRALAAQAGHPVFATVHLTASGSTGDASLFSVTVSAGTTWTLQAWMDALAALQTGGGGGSSGAGNLAIGTVTSVAAGTAPSASISNGLLDLALERGATGATGPQGRAGSAASVTSPSITAAGGALLASPALSGTPTTPTGAAGDASTQIASDAFVSLAVAAPGLGSASKATLGTSRPVVPLLGGTDTWSAPQAFGNTAFLSMTPSGSLGSSTMAAAGTPFYLQATFSGAPTGGPTGDASPFSLVINDGTTGPSFGGLQIADASSGSNSGIRQALNATVTRYAAAPAGTDDGFVGGHESARG